MKYVPLKDLKLETEYNFYAWDGYWGSTSDPKFRFKGVVRIRSFCGLDVLVRWGNNTSQMEDMTLYGTDWICRYIF